MAHEYADDDPNASEYAGKGSPNDSDNDEGLYAKLLCLLILHMLIQKKFLPFVSLDYESDHSGTTPVAVLIAVVSVCLIALPAEW